ncbi:MAG: SUMF1/EgtB/PvdO family nonheme iron enzyme [Planctomycetaceae bacterium]
MTVTPKDDESQKQRKLAGILAQIRSRRESGKSVDLDAVVRAFPELEKELRAHFAPQNPQVLSSGVFADTKLQSPESIASNRETQDGGAQTADTASEFTARSLGRYRLLRPLGEGAMGSVFLALDTTLDRRVALKMPKTITGDTAEFLARFTREARAAARLSHPNICRVYDAGEIDGTAFITMDFIDGTPLSRQIGSFPLQSVSEVLRIAGLIASAMAHAHASGIIHRDLKPGNILLDEQRTPFVTDFGLARRLVPSEGTRITQEGLLIGTPAYMSPEQVRGQQDLVGVASDIYSFGVVLFEMLTGRLPFDGPLSELLAKVLRDSPPVPSRLRPELTEDIDIFLLKMLQKDPNHRYRSMGDVTAAIQRLESQWNTSKPSVKPANRPAEHGVGQPQPANPFEILKSHIEVMLQKGQYATAIQDLEKLAAETTPLAKSAATWAKNKLPSAKAEARAMSPSALSSLLQTAQEMFKRHDYPGCIQLLSEVPSLRRTPAMEELMDRAQEQENEADMLLEDIRDRERREIIDGLEPLVRKLLKIKPGNSYAKKLMQALQTYSTTHPSRRKYRFERGRLQPMPEASLFQQYLVLGILVGVLVFLATYAYVIIYLKSGAQTLAVYVDDDWLKQQGGELTLVVDGDQHTISAASAMTIVVKLGDREFSVKHGDTIVHNPRKFTIERNGKSILQITPTDIELTNAPPPARMPSGVEVANGNSATPASGASVPAPGSSAAVTDSEANASPWVELFDGKDTSHWQTLGLFEVENGLLTGRKGRTMAVSRDVFGDFELEAEWRYTETSTNGGIFYREQETTDGAGNEYQLIDPKHPGATSQIHRTGAFYGVIPAIDGSEKPMGEWNIARVVCRGADVEHWLNGNLVCSFNTDSELWKKQLAEFPFKQAKEKIGTARSGHILLQAQTGNLAFRRIRIREFSKAQDKREQSRATTPAEAVPENLVSNGEKWSVIQGATLEGLMAWKDTLAPKLYPHRITLRAGSGEQIFDAIAEPNPDGAEWVMRVSNGPDDWPNELEGFRPVTIVPFRDGAKVRRLCVGTKAHPSWSIWVGNLELMREKILDGMREHRDVPDYLCSYRWFKEGEWVVVRIPSDRNAVELHTDLSETDFAELLRSARERKMRPLMIDHHHSGGEKDLYAVLANDQAGDWAVSQRISGAHLARLIPAVEAHGARAWFMASSASSGEVVYRVLWRGITPDILSNAEVATRAAGSLPATAYSVFKLPPRPQVVTPDGTPISAIAPFDSETALRYQEAWAKHLQVPVEYTNSIGMKFRLIPSGTFRMGSTPEEVQKAKPLLTDYQRDGTDRKPRADSESPPQIVTLTRPFFLGVTEVTQEQYEKIARANPSRWKNEGPGNRQLAPVEMVSWMQAGAFCNLLSESEGLVSAYRITPELITQTGVGGYRLPTEAEWEFACRAGTTTLYFTGEDSKQLSSIAWFANSGGETTQPVAQKLPNAFGLYDMHGNVFEWVHDVWRPDWYSTLTQANAVDPRCDTGPEPRRVIRGGNYGLSAEESRSASRDACMQDSVWWETGFRVAMSVEAVRALRSIGK